MPPLGSRLLKLKKHALYIIAVILLGLLPFSNSTYLMYLIGTILIMAIFAMGFNLLFGYTGLLSFGHAMFFGISAYTVAMLMKYYKIYAFEVLFTCGVLAAVLLAVVIGYICVRHTKIYFSLLTLGFCQVEYTLAVKLYNITGGTDGMRVYIPALLGFKITDKGFFICWPYYYTILSIFIACTIVMWLIVNSHFGKVLQAIRDNDLRVNFMGVSEKRYKWYAFILSGLFSGVAGALFAPLNGQIGPEYTSWLFSADPVFISLLGGYRNFVGPIIGSFAYILLRHFITGYTIYWEFFLGLVIIALTLVFPYGISGVVTLWLRRRRISS